MTTTPPAAQFPPQGTVKELREWLNEYPDKIWNVAYEGKMTGAEAFALAADGNLVDICEPDELDWPYMYTEGAEWGEEDEELGLYCLNKHTMRPEVPARCDFVEVA